MKNDRGIDSKSLAGGMPALPGTDFRTLSNRWTTSEARILVYSPALTSREAYPIPRSSFLGGLYLNPILGISLTRCYAAFIKLTPMGA